MNNELNKHKNSDKVKWWLTLIAFLLIAATLAGILLGYLTPRNNEEKPVQNEQQETADIGGLVVNESVNSGMSFKSVKLMKNDYETYGITQSAESAFILNAIITPDTAVNQGVAWDMFWLGEKSEFSQDKNASDYVTITPNGENGTSATIECLAPFGDSIIVQAVSQDNPNCRAFCQLDYAQKVTDVYLEIGNVPVVLDGITEVQYEISPYAQGMGGVIRCHVETSDVYTKAQNFTTSVIFNQDPIGDNWFRISDKYPTGIQLLYRGLTEWIGEEYYFDYTNDISKWLIFQRDGDIKFSDLTTAQVTDYFSNITGPTLAVLSLVVMGTYDSYSYTSKINCTGFTNSTPVNGLDFDRTEYVF